MFVVKIALGLHMCKYFAAYRVKKKNRNYNSVALLKVDIFARKYVAKACFPVRAQHSTVLGSGLWDRVATVTTSLFNTTTTVCITR